MLKNKEKMKKRENYNKVREKKRYMYKVMKRKKGGEEKEEV